MWRAIALLLCVSLVACGAESSSDAANPVQPDFAREIATRFDRNLCPTGATAPGDFRFCGPINESAVSEIDAAVRSGMKRLIVSSPGGRDDLTIEISEALDKAGIRLVFEKFCLSACAHFLFLPAENPLVVEGTLIGFRQTTASYGLFRAGRDLSDRERFTEYAVDTLNRAAELYLWHELERAWLIEPTVRTKPTCFVENIDWSDPKFPKLEYRSEYDFWVPSRLMIERLGRGPFEGYWPDTKDSARALINDIGAEIGVGSVFFGGQPTFSTDLAPLNALPTCESEGQ